jgi:serine protease AprX
MSEKRLPHDHPHEPNRFAAIPTPVRLDADTERTGRGVVIALLDSGFTAHPDLTTPHDRVAAYVDLAGGPAVLPLEASDSSVWHGTQTSVVCAGNGALSDGVYRSLAPDARVVLVKVSRNGRIGDAEIAAGLEWVLAQHRRLGIRIVNLSIGGDVDASAAHSRIDRLADALAEEGVVVVAAAGNQGCTERPQPIPPANAPSVITVGGYDDDNVLDAASLSTYCSSHGLTIDGVLKPEVMAPAAWVAAPIPIGSAAAGLADALSQLASTPDYALPRAVALLGSRTELPDKLRDMPPGDIRDAVDASLRAHGIIATHYQRVDGTSFAAPIVSSIVAQMIEANPALTPEMVKALLIATADRVAGIPVARQGYGIVHSRRAVAAASSERHASSRAVLRAPRVHGTHLVLSYHDDEARSVALAGDFNAWNPVCSPFSRSDEGLWRLEVESPPPGRYRYKLVIDGQRWIEDPACWLREANPYGGFDSLIHVTSGPYEAPGDMAHAERM